MTEPKKKPESAADFSFGANVEREDNEFGTTKLPKDSLIHSIPKEETALAVVPPEFRGIMNVAEYEQYKAEIAEASSDELFGVNYMKLIPRIKVPSGGATAFEVSDGDPKKQLEVAIVVVQRANAYWYPQRHNLYSLDNKAPVCTSMDLQHGSHPMVDIKDDFLYSAVNPKEFNGREYMFGSCVTCILNQYGSALNDAGEFTKGKACKNTIRLFCFDVAKFVQGDDVPYLLSLSPASIGNWESYVGLVKSMTKGGSTLLVTTKLSLDVTAGSGAIKYSKVKFEIGSFLAKDNPALLAKLVQWRSAQKETLKQVQINAGDIND